MTTNKLSCLRQLMNERQLQGYMVPKANMFQCEHLMPAEERLKWLTEFTGSAGFCIVLHTRAILFVDGRYYLQAHHEVDDNLFEIIDTGITSVTVWLGQNFFSEMKMGYDPWLLTYHQVCQYHKILQGKGADLLPIHENMIDLCWHNKPSTPLRPIRLHRLEVAGLSYEDKLNHLRQHLREKGAMGIVLTTIESVNWLFNIRGDDLVYMPVVFGYALIDVHDQAIFFTDLQKVTPEIRSYFEGKVTIEDLSLFTRHLKEYASRKMPLIIDSHFIPSEVVTLIQAVGGSILWSDDPVLLARACKNPIEIQGMRNTHERDGAALTMFLQWLMAEGIPHRILESEAAHKLHAFRSHLPTLWGESFPTISASGPHGAIIHYHVNPQTDRPLSPQEIYLVDSGAHYHDGSTDVTRTILQGSPTSEQKTHFTCVLKGHIALARAVFPEGTMGCHLDGLARQFLWAEGLDYAHGTGHGVGSVLNIHEGPQGISKALNSVVLKPGMIVSNEPGYYRENHYGIRIESLMVVIVDKRFVTSPPMLKFEVLTLAPIDLNLIDFSVITPEEQEWLYSYHQKIAISLGPFVNQATKDWLLRLTKNTLKQKVV